MSTVGSSFPVPSFLLDSNTSPKAANLLRQKGIPATHIREIGPSTTPDATIVRLAVERGEIIVTYDNDFPEMLAYSQALEPSVVLLREGSPTRPQELAKFLADLPDGILQALAEGAIVSFDGKRFRIRRLPIG